MLTIYGPPVEQTDRTALQLLDARATGFACAKRGRKRRSDLTGDAAVEFDIGWLEWHASQAPRTRPFHRQRNLFDS